MAESSWPKSFEWVVEHEGGYVDHPDDPGGATNLGITIGTLSAHLRRKATKAEVRALTKDDVEPIYRKRYWNMIRGDDLPPGVDHAAFDYAVNSGPARSAKALQGVVGVEQDGIIGPVTMDAVRKLGVRTVIDGLQDERLRFLKRLSTWPTFGRGWKKRVDRVRDEAKSLIGKKGDGAPIRDDDISKEPPMGWLERLVDTVLSIFRR